MNYNDIFMHHYSGSDFLCHHGIKGQKWGIRRFQNTDGSLTAAGKLRYMHDLSEVKKAYSVKEHAARLKPVYDEYVAAHKAVNESKTKENEDRFSKAASDYQQQLNEAAYSEYQKVGNGPLKKIIFTGEKLNATQTTDYLYSIIQDELMRNDKSTKKESKE